MPEAVVAPQPAAPVAPNRFVIPDEPAESVKPAQNTGEQAPPTPTEGEAPKAEEPTPEQAAKREGRRFERKLDKAYRQRAEAQARAELLEKQLNEFKAQGAPKPQADGKPTLEQFDYDPQKYAEAVAEYTKKQTEREFQEKQRTETQKQHQARITSEWEEKVSKVEDKYDDWDTVVGEIKPDNPITAAILEADNGPDIAYYLGKNPKEATRLVQLLKTSPLSAIREIGKLEAKLASEPEKPKTPSKAPAPITPLTGAATVPSPEPSESDDMNAWMKKRQKQVHGKR